jgi:hypothetical protein
MMAHDIGMTRLAWAAPSVVRQWDHGYEEALQLEGQHGATTAILREAVAGAKDFSGGARRKE